MTNISKGGFKYKGGSDHFVHNDESLWKIVAWHLSFDQRTSTWTHLLQRLKKTVPFYLLLVSGCALLFMLKKESSCRKDFKIGNLLQIPLLIPSELIDFYPPWNHHKTICFLIISREIEVNKFAQTCLILEVQYGDNPQLRNGFITWTFLKLVLRKW